MNKIILVGAAFLAGCAPTGKQRIPAYYDPHTNAIEVRITEAMGNYSTVNVVVTDKIEMPSGLYKPNHRR